MKIKTLFTAAAVLASVSLALVSCFSPWTGGEATLTISVGNSSRVLVNKDDNEQDGFSYELIMTGPGGKLDFQFDPGVPIIVTVIPGNWQVELRAMGTSDFLDAPELEFDDVILRAIGEWEGTVDGNTTATITMTSAMEVSSWAQLEAVVWGDPNGDRKEIILLKNGLSDWEADLSINITRPIELRAVEPITINRDANFEASLFLVNTGGILALKGPLTLDGSGVASSSLISVIGKLEMYDGVTLQNNSISASSGFGGGVVVADEGDFTMHGGTIKDNTAIMGGGVAVAGEGDFTMHDGTINANTAEMTGGGVAVIGGTITMTNGNISGNKAMNGGGVIIGLGTFTMTGGNISGNSATGSGGIGGNGGGVGVEGEGVFNMNGGTIKNNTAKGSSSGGGGGGVFSSGTFTMTDGSITENYATVSSYAEGGGVYVGGGTFDMTGGSISGNDGYNGGGVIVVESTFTMTGGSISVNTATDGNGGGVGVSEHGKFNMDGGSISGNEAADGGGVGVFNGGTFTMTSGSVSGNNAEAKGGGVSIGHNGTSGQFTKTGGGTIYGGSTDDVKLKNTAGSDGDAVYNHITSSAINYTLLPADDYPTL